jgi:hypothetical protein
VVALMAKRVYDVAGVLNKGCKVSSAVLQVAVHCIRNSMLCWWYDTQYDNGVLRSVGEATSCAAHAHRTARTLQVAPACTSTPVPRAAHIHLPFLMHSSFALLSLCCIGVPERQPAAHQELCGLLRPVPAPHPTPTRPSSFAFLSHCSICAAPCIHQVYLNDARLPIKRFADYCDLYLCHESFIFNLPFLTHCSLCTALSAVQVYLNGARLPCVLLFAFLTHCPSQSAASAYTRCT